MGAFAFRTDPSITARGIAPAFDPIAAMSRIANLRRLQQRGQVNKLQLEDFQRERNRQTAIRGAATRSRGDRAKFLQELSQVAPVARFDYEAQFAKQDIELGKDQRAARKNQLENASKTFELIGQLAGPLNALEEQGADLETLQVAYADSLGRLAATGVDTSKLPQEYKPGMAQQAMMEAVTEKDRIDQALRADEAAERKAARERKVPGRDVPFSPKVEAQKKRISAARRAQRRTATEIQIELYTKDPELYEQIFDRVGIRNERQMRLKVIEAAMRLSESVSGQVDEKVFAKKLAELSSLVGVELENQGQPQVSRTATREEVEAFAQSKGISYQEAARQLQAEGYTIQ